MFYILASGDVNPTILSYNVDAVLDCGKLSYPPTSVRCSEVIVNPDHRGTLNSDVYRAAGNTLIAVAVGRREGHGVRRGSLVGLSLRSIKPKTTRYACRAADKLSCVDALAEKDICCGRPSRDGWREPVGLKEM